LNQVLFVLEINDSSETKMSHTIVLVSEGEFLCIILCIIIRLDKIIWEGEQIIFSYAFHIAPAKPFHLLFIILESCWMLECDWLVDDPSRCGIIFRENKV